MKIEFSRQIFERKKNPKYYFSSKSVLWESLFHADGQTDMRTLIVDIRNFTHAPKNVILRILISEYHKLRSTLSLSKHQKNLRFPFPLFFLIPLSFHVPDSNHAISLLPFVAQHSFSHRLHTVLMTSSQSQTMKYVTRNSRRTVQVSNREC
jgi:hypothetical protein